MMEAIQRCYRSRVARNPTASIRIRLIDQERAEALLTSLRHRQHLIRIEAE